MDPKRFDALARSLAAAVDRRRAVKGALAGVLAGAVAARGPVGAGAESEQTCSPKDCAPGAEGDELCKAHGGNDCVCVAAAAEARDATPGGRCGSRTPATCSAAPCAPGDLGDAFCLDLGGPGCACVPPVPAEAGAQDATPEGRCGTGPGPCVPTTCAALGAECGEQPDGCGGTPLQCGVCPIPGSTCDNGICRPPGPCVPETEAEACRGLECGTASDGCGGRYTCGRCPNGERCLGTRCERPRPNDRCPGHGLAQQPCGGRRCKCKNGRRCHNGRCCEPIGDGSVHCNSDADCCPGLTCARKAGGRHKTCLRKPIGRAAVAA